MKKYLFIALLFVGFLSFGQSALNQKIKSQVIVPQATAPSNPTLYQQYRNLSGDLEMWNGNAWEVIENLTEIDKAKLNLIAIANNIDLDALLATANSALQAEVDGSISNELQNLSFDLTGNNLTITISDGNNIVIDLSALAGTGYISDSTELDSEIGSLGYLKTEAQDITLIGNNLSITGGSTITLPVSSGGATNTFESYGAIANDGLPDDDALEAAIADNIAGNLNKLGGSGTYNFNDSHSWHQTVDFELDFEVGTVFTTNTISGIIHTAEAENRVSRPTFRNITFENTFVSSETVQNFSHPAVVFFGAGQLDTPRFFNCKFTAPNAPMDGIKIVNETVLGETAADGNIRFTKNLLIDGCETYDTGRMGMEFFTSFESERDPSLFNTTVINSTFRNPGTVETQHDFGVSFAGVGSGLYTANNRFYEVRGVGFETVDISEISHNENWFYHNGVDTGRMYGSSDETPIRNMTINGGGEIGVPPTGQGHNSYFQNVRNLNINGTRFENGIVVGSDGNPTQEVSKVKLNDVEIYARHGFSAINMFGKVTDFEVFNSRLEVLNSSAAVWNVNGDDQTKIKMVRGLAKNDGGVFQINNTGTSLVEIEHALFNNGTTEVLLEGYNQAATGGFDPLVSNTFEGKQKFGLDGTSFMVAIEGGSPQGGNIQFGTRTDNDQYGKWGTFNSVMNVAAFDRDLYLSATDGGSILVDKQTNRVGIGNGTVQPQYTLDVAGTVNATEFLLNGSPLSTGSGTAAPFSGYYINTNGTNFTATAIDNGMQDFSGTDFTAVLNQIKAELVAERPGDPSITIILGEGSFTIQNFLWDLTGVTSNVYNGLTIKGQGDATNLNVSGAGNSGIILKNNARVKIENLNGYVFPAAENYVKSMSDGTNEGGTRHSTFRDLYVKSDSESDVFQLVNAMFNLFDNVDIASKNGTPVHFRNESVTTAFGNSTIQNCYFTYGSGTEDQGIRTTSSTEFPNINDITILNTKSYAFAGENGENNGGTLGQGWAVNFESGTNFSLINPDFEYGNGVKIDSVDGFGISGGASYILPKSSTGLVATGIYVTQNASNVHIPYVKIDGAGLEPDNTLSSDYTRAIVIEDAGSFKGRVKIHGKLNGVTAIDEIQIGENRTVDINMDVGDSGRPFIRNSSLIESAHSDILEKAFRKEIDSVNIIFTGDSRNDAYYTRLVEYAKKQAAKVNILVDQNALSGQSIAGWEANTSSFFEKGTLNEAISLTRGKGEHTKMVFSLGYNDANSTVAEYVTLIESALDAYLLEKPLTEIILSTPYFSAVGSKNDNLKAAYLQVAIDRGYEYVDSQQVTEDVFTDPNFYWDDTHQDYFGSIRVVNHLFEQIMPGNLLKHITLEDPDPYVMNISGQIATVETGAWRSYDGLDITDANQVRFTEILNPPANSIIEITFTNNLNPATALLLDANGDRVEGITYFLSRKSKDNNKYQIRVPEGTVSARINIASNKATYDGFGEVPTIEYKSDAITLTQKEINEGLTLTQPYIEVKDGSVWRTGAGAPSNNLGKDTDLYLDTTTQDVYRKDAEVYTLESNIKGERGDANLEIWDLNETETDRVVKLDGLHVTGQKLVFAIKSETAQTSIEPDSGVNFIYKGKSGSNNSVRLNTYGSMITATKTENANEYFIEEGWDVQFISCLADVNEVYTVSNALSDKNCNESAVLPSNTGESNAIITLETGSGDQLQGGNVVRLEAANIANDAYMDLRPVNAVAGDAYTVTYSVRKSRAGMTAETGTSWFGVSGEVQHDINETFTEHTQTVTIDSNDPGARFRFHIRSTNAQTGDFIEVGYLSIIKTN